MGEPSQSIVKRRCFVIVKLRLTQLASAVWVRYRAAPEHQRKDISAPLPVAFIATVQSVYFCSRVLMVVGVRFEETIDPSTASRGHLLNQHQLHLKSTI